MLIQIYVIDRLVFLINRHQMVQVGSFRDEKASILNPLYQ